MFSDGSEKTKIAFQPFPTCPFHFDSKSEFKLGKPSKVGIMDAYEEEMEGALHFATSIGKNPIKDGVLVGYGVSKSKDLSEIKSKVELYERLCYYLAPRGKIRYDKKIPLLEFQFTDGNPIFAPLNLIFGGGMNGARDRYSYSTAGLALHSSRQLAIESAIDEAMEKNYALLAFAGLVGHHQKIALTDFEPAIENLFTKRGYETFFYFIENHGRFYFTCYCFASDPQLPSLVCCSSVAKNFNEGIEKAACELFGMVRHASEVYLKPSEQEPNAAYSNFLHYLEGGHALDLMETFPGKLMGTSEVQLSQLSELESFITDIFDATQYGFCERGNALTDSQGLYAFHALHMAGAERLEIIRHNDEEVYPYA